MDKRELSEPILLELLKHAADAIVDEMAIAPAIPCIHGSSARNKRLSDSPVIRGERRSSGIFATREQTT